MDITILGSGGNAPTPMPTCDCRVCVEARDRGVPDARRGNSAERTVFTELEELYRRSHDDYRALARTLTEREGLDIAFAHDGMVLSV